MNQRNIEQMSDADLLRAAHRQPAAFQEFYGRHCSSTERWITGQVRDRELAIDLTAETFAQALVSLRKFRGSGDDGARWLHGIARNLCLEYFRRQRVSRQATEKLGLDMRYVLHGDDPADQHALADIEPELQEAVSALPDHERAALMLRVVSELSYREIARQLGCSETAARIRVFKALRTLRTTVRADSMAASLALLDGGATK